MAVKHSAEVTVYDVTDAYSVTLTNEAASLKATSDTKLGTAATVTTKPQAFLGTDVVACTVVQADCVCSDSTNVSVSVNSTGDNATWPLLTISIGANATAGGTVTIPVVIGSGANAVTIEKVFSYSIALKGASGDPGDDPYTLSITSDNGTVLKNNTGQTTLTAHVYQAGAELNAMPSGHAIKWYVDGTLAETDSSLPATFTRTAAQVANKAVVRAQLEG